MTASGDLVRGLDTLGYLISGLFPLPPIPRPPALMGERENEDLTGLAAIDNRIGEAFNENPP